MPRLPFAWIFRRRRHKRLIRSYFLASALLIAGGLVSAGVLEIYFRYVEGLEQVSVAQQAVAAGAALRIERFIQDIATTMAAATKSASVSSPEVSREYVFELRRLLFLAPAITEAAALDRNGVEQAQISRVRAVAPLAGRDVSHSDAFLEAKRGRAYFGPVYFRGADPYITIAVPIEQVVGEISGVLRAEANLRDILDVVSGIKLGRAGYAYVVTRSGDVLAHPTIALIVNRRNVGDLTQVQVAFQPPRPGAALPAAIVARSIDGRKVLSSHAPIPLVDWAVVIERPSGDAFEPIYASLMHTATLLLVGLGVALLASMFVARRVVRPLNTLRQGVERIGGGDLGVRLDIKTGDEIQILAEQFNEMSRHLQEAHAHLEEKVANRTEALMIANEKLAEASRHKSKFLANVNHELRTPVAAIIGFGRLLQRESESGLSPVQQENLRDLLKNADRLLRLIDSLLDLVKIEAGQMDVCAQPVAVAELIQEAASTIEPILNESGVRLVQDIDPGLPVLNADRDKLTQIILNLLDNAAKFTARGAIRISASQQQGALKLVVADTGIGIEADDVDRIFDEFRRGNSASRGMYRGTGLGLAIVQKLVNVLGGRIDVQSEVGKGSTFTVTLPLDARRMYAHVE